MGVDDTITLAFVGLPNVGKSSLLNRLLGEERVITSEMAGTTRDTVMVDFQVAAWLVNLSVEGESGGLRGS